MKASFDDVLTAVWRQALVDNANVVKVSAERYPVTRSKAKRLRQVAFVFDGNTIMGIEQNPKTKSRWAQMSLGEEGYAIHSGRSVRGCCGGRESDLVRQA